MIRTPTVLVLGAGASQPYGFPSGAELAESVCRHIEDSNHILGSVLRKKGTAIFLSVSYRENFEGLGSTRWTTFLRVGQSFREIVKLAIVHELMPLEDDETLLPPTPKRNTHCVG
jgi:hypothetical protein